jgi:hypothetical protein
MASDMLMKMTVWSYVLLATCGAVPISQSRKEEMCPSKMECSSNHQDRTIVCEYSKPKLLFHPLWTVNGSNVAESTVTLLTLNDTHHITVLNYSAFQAGVYELNLEYSRLVGPFRAFCQHLVPHYSSLLMVTDSPCYKDRSLTDAQGKELTPTSTLQLAKSLISILEKLLSGQATE